MALIYFMRIVGEGNLEFVKFMVDLGADVNAVGKEGDFALQIAARDGAQNIFDYLYPLTREDLREEAKESLNNDLIWSVRNNSFEELQNYILLGADVNAIGAQGETALHVACYLGHLDLIVKLLESGADINREVNGETPLSVARQANQPEVVQLLIANGAKSLI